MKTIDFIKRSFFFILLFYHISIFAIHLDLIGPCSEKPIFQGSFDVQNLKKQSIGEVTIGAFDLNGISYKGIFWT